MRTTRRTSKLDRTLLANDISFLIANARSMATKMANSRLAMFDLDLRMYSILYAVSSGDGPSQRELADFLHLDTRQVMYVLDNLELRGLVIRRTDPDDRRLNIIETTDKGKEIAAKAGKVVQQVEDEYLRNLTPEQTDSLRMLLQLVVMPNSADLDDVT